MKKTYVVWRVFSKITTTRNWHQKSLENKPGKPTQLKPTAKDEGTKKEWGTDWGGLSGCAFAAAKA